MMSSSEKRENEAGHDIVKKAIANARSDENAAFNIKTSSGKF